MIKRTNDYNVFSDDELNKIANVVKKSENRKLYDIYDDRNKAHIVKDELQIKGFKADVFSSGGKYHVYASTPDSISLEKAESSGQFKKLAWGRYCFQRESAIGNFDFDDGSIWKLSSDENGNPILIKEVMDEDEEEVVRNNTKTANLVKQATIYTNDSNLNAITQMIYGQPLNSTFVTDLMASNAKQSVFDMLDGKIDTIVTSKLDSAGIEDQTVVDELKNLISSSLGSQITDDETLESFISTYLDQKMDKVGSQRKYFSK